MKDYAIDVLLEVPVKELARLHDPASAVMERMRDKADRMCDEAGARLRTDRAPEVTVSQAIHPLLGDMTLFASRWAVVAPEDLEPTPRH